MQLSRTLLQIVSCIHRTYFVAPTKVEAQGDGTSLAPGHALGGSRLRGNDADGVIQTKRELLYARVSRVRRVKEGSSCSRASARFTMP